MEKAQTPPNADNAPQMPTAQKAQNVPPTPKAQNVQKRTMRCKSAELKISQFSPPNLNFV